MEALVLAGGLGTRLREITKDRMPKPMVPVPYSGKEYPLLEFVLGNLYRQGISSFVICTGHMADCVESYFGDGSGFGVSITYSNSGVDANTGARIREAGNFISGDKFLVVCGDVYHPFPLEGLVRKLDGAMGAMGIYVPDGTMQDTIPNVGLDKEGRVLHYSRTGVDEGIKGIETGYLAFSRDVISMVPQGMDISITQDLYPLMIRDRDLRGYITPVKFSDVGTPAKYHEFCDYVNSHCIKPLSMEVPR